VSQRLKRLREDLDDELLVPRGGASGLTDRAAALAPRLRELVEDLDDLIVGVQNFDPCSAERVFTIATSDYGQMRSLPQALRVLSHEAPGISIQVTASTLDTPQQLAQGKIDLVVGAGLPRTQELMRKKIGSEGFIVLMRAGHPALRKRFDLDAFTSWPHLLISPRGQPGSLVDQCLEKIGRKRRVALIVPHFLSAPHVVAETDLLLTCPVGLAERYAPLLGLKTRALPLDLDELPLEIIWHARSQSDPAHRWLRELVVRVAGDEQVT
jgi:DNA-binding transcriptional LysR family regulator